MASVKPIPDGYHTITPYLVAKGASKAIEFYKKAFGAKELFRMADPTGKVGHAELQIGDSKLMICDEFPEMNAWAPEGNRGTGSMIHLYVEDADAFFRQAVSAGAKVERDVETQFYGDRGGKVSDPFGHAWYISTHVEDVGPDELKRRAAEMAKYRDREPATNAPSSNS